MKLNYFLKSFVLVMLMTFVTNVKATEFNVRNGATDTDLAAALEQAQTGDVILINGWVTINAAVQIDKNVTIKAGVGNAGFEGSGNSRLFEIHPEPVSGAKLVFEDLGFVGGDAIAKATGTDEKGGGAAIINAGVTEFNNCYFEDNVALRGGAIMVMEDGTTVTFKHCDAQGNIARSDNDESRGGYLFTDGGVHITHEFCQISGNQAIGNRGGALCIFGTGTHRFYYTVISSNQAGNWSDDESKKLDKNGNETTSGEYEGGVAFINGTPAITFESCGIIFNKSWSHGGIIRGFGGANVTFINTTLAKNRSMHDRSPLWIGGASTYTFVNSLLVENQGQNQGNGAGFDFDGANVHLNIFNSVFARNVAGTDGAVDIRNASDYAAQMVIKNSLIGLIQGSTSTVEAQDSPSIPTKSNTHMYKVDDNETASIEYASLENSGVDYSKGIRYSKWGMPYYLLKENSTVSKLGDPALLAGYDSDLDLFERVRIPAADGSITAAPTLLATEDDYDDTAITEPSGISIPKTSALENIRIICASNGILGVDFGELKGHAKGTLVSITGQSIEKVFDINVVGKGFYNINVAPGMYILRVEIGGKTYAQKLIATK